MKNPWREVSKVNPQKEDGHREINNDVYHALLAAKLPGAIYQIIFAVIDKTWGFAKHGAPLSLTQFQEMTGLSRSGVCKAVKQAEQRRLIVVEKQSTKVSKYIFNKHYDTWLTSPLEQTSASLPESTSREGQLVHQRALSLSTPVDYSSPPEWTSTSPLVTRGTVRVKKELKKPLKKYLKKERFFKKRYGEFNNVLLTAEEYHKLEERFGIAECQRMIEVLSSGMKAKKWYRYDSHYAAILNWKRKEEKGEEGKAKPSEYGDSGTYKPVEVSNERQ